MVCVVELDGYYDGSLLVVVSPGWLCRLFWLAMLFSERFGPVLFVYWWDYAIMLDTWKVLCWLLVNFTYKL
jgi:hypothetical protein